MARLKSPDPWSKWSELFPELLDEIVKYIYSYKDYVAIRGTCKAWNLVLPKIPEHIRGPWLILPFEENATHFDVTEEFHNLKVSRLGMPEMKEIVLHGSCFGWLIGMTIDGTVQASNPFTRSHFNFPKVICYPPHKPGREYLACHLCFDKMYMQKYHIKKIILSCSPNQGKELMAVAIYGRHHGLAFYKFGDDKWTDITMQETTSYSHYGYVDAIFHDGKIYVLDVTAQVFEFDLKTSFRWISMGVSPPEPHDTVISLNKVRKYLACKPNGDMFLVLRYLIFYQEQNPNGWYDKHYRTYSFSVFKLNKSTKSWCKESSLGNYVLVVGLHSSLWMQTFGDDEGKWIKNCIYYSDDPFFRRSHDHCIYYSDDPFFRRSHDHDVGIFNFETSENNPIFSYSHGSPTWVCHP